LENARYFHTSYWLGLFFLFFIVLFTLLLSFLSQGNTIENDSKIRTAENWSEDDVSAWLCAQGFAELVGLFKANNIDGKELVNLTRESLIHELKIGKSTEIQIVCNLLCICRMLE